MGQKQVILYSQAGCPPCFAAKNFLKARGVGFVYKDVMEDPQALKELMDLNSRSTPTLVVGEGENRQVMIGFDPEKLEKLLAED
jgi:glutaredoxin